MSELKLVVALPAEARPFIDHFRLRADETVRGLRLYRGGAEDRAVTLALSGPGKAAAAAAVGYLAAGDPRPAVWLNCGIAGHGRVPAGDVVMAHAVLDQATGESLYPPLVVEPPCPTSAVTSVDRPETAYPEDCAYDMEASAFLAAARRFASAELVHCLKVVSDGPESPLPGLDRQKIRGLMAAALAPCLQLWHRLRPLADELEALEAVPPLEEDLIARWHFSLSDHRALRRELRRCGVLSGGELPPDLFADVRRGREAVRRLREFLDRRAAFGPAAEAALPAPSAR